MKFQIKHKAFERRKLEVEFSGFFYSMTLLLDGIPNKEDSVFYS